MDLHIQRKAEELATHCEKRANKVKHKQNNGNTCHYNSHDTDKGQRATSTGSAIPKKGNNRGEQASYKGNEGSPYGNKISYQLFFFTYLFFLNFFCHLLRNRIYTTTKNKTATNNVYRSTMPNTRKKRLNNSIIQYQPNIANNHGGEPYPTIHERKCQVSQQ